MNLDFQVKHDGGIQAVEKFDNGYGVSVVKHNFSYGHEEGLYELAVLDSSGDICYDTPITNDVMGHLTLSKVLKVMKKVSKL